MLNTSLINDVYNNNFKKQLIWFITGIMVFIISIIINPKIIIKISPYLYLLNIILLLAVLFIGTKINGSRAWFRFGEIAFQPSELMKLSLILSANTIKYKKDIVYIIKLSIITLIPSILVFLEPDTGAIIFYLIIYLCFIYFKNIKKIYKYLITIFFGLGIIIFCYLFFFQSHLLMKIFGTGIFYRLDRLINFRSGYQIENALIVIGSSLPLNLKLYDISLYIPEAPTDFIFAFSIGNFGYIIGLVIIILYFFICFFILHKAKNKNNTMAIPIFFMFLFQVLINIGMNLNIFPIMGIPLPFLSYGGSNIIIYFIIFGLLINFSMDDSNSYNHNYTPQDNKDMTDNYCLDKHLLLDEV